MGGFEFLFQGNLKERHKRSRTYVCECQRKATTKKLRQVRWRQCQEQRIDIFIPYHLLGLSTEHFF